MKTPNHAQLTPQELEELLDTFSTERQKRIIRGVALNPGVLSHEVWQNFYCTYVPSFVQEVDVRLANAGLEMGCVKPYRGAHHRSWHWYLCLSGELEAFDTAVQSANDDVL